MIRLLLISFSIALFTLSLFTGLPDLLLHYSPLTIKAGRSFYQDILVFISFSTGAYALICLSSGPKEKYVCRIKNFKWNLNDFCRGWLITGKTGSGKTASAIAHIIHQLFQRVCSKNGFKAWGGVAVDQKGNFFRIIEDIAAHYSQSDRLITLKVRPEGVSSIWKPRYKYNLLSYPGIPASTYAKIIIDTAASLGQDSGGGSGSFFKTQAQLQIQKAIELLKLLQSLKEDPEVTHLGQKLNPEPTGHSTSDLDFYNSFMPDYPSLKNVFTILTDKTYLERILDILRVVIEQNLLHTKPEKNNQIQLLRDHFTLKFLKQPPDQLGGVIGTIHNYLGFFTSDDICEVFCAETNTVEFEEVDEGKIFSVSMPQRYQSERIYVNTLMKLIYYTHALRRFDDPDSLKDNNLLIFIADEAQGVVTASKDGMTDYTVVDKIREARATVLFAAQSTTSFMPVMRKEQVDTLLLNLANQVHYTAADENNAGLIADVIGKKEILKKSRGFSGGKRSFNFQPVDEHIIKPYVLRAMKKFQCVLIHCEKGYKKFTLAPIGPDGRIPAYFRKIKN